MALGPLQRSASSARGSRSWRSPRKLSDALILRAVGHVGSAEEAARSLANASAQDRLRVGLMLAIPHGLALAIAAVAGGFLVGRFGKGLGLARATIAGVAFGDRHRRAHVRRRGRVGLLGAARPGHSVRRRRRRARSAQGAPRRRLRAYLIGSSFF
ncbi:MAG: hypothetical protein IPQ09_25345 [Myxococcales bacterium]|nr:hypothetical protein [Myxococcales bacterium]